MTDFKAYLRAGERGWSRSWAGRIVVCLILAAFLAVMNVPHKHSIENRADHCPLCVAMHSTAPVPVAIATVVLAPVCAIEPQSEPETVRHDQPSRLFLRPPPSGSLA